MKKAQGMQFNWIFIAVSGAIIMIFFAGFGVRYMQLQKSRENAEIARNIDRIINGLKGQEQYKTIDINTDFHFEFRCNSFRINKDYLQNLNGKIIFTQKNFKVNKLYAWTKEFKRPFKIDNLVYLIDTNFNYYLIKDGNEEHVNDIYNEMPSKFSNINVIDIQDLINKDIRGKNNEFVFFTEPTTYQIDILKDKGRIITIDNSRKKIIFNNIGESDLIDRSLVFGAIFSGDYESYKCSYDELVNKFGNINSIYIKKAENLDKCCNNGICDYSRIKDKLTGLKIDSSDLEVNEIESMNKELADINIGNNACKVVF